MASLAMVYGGGGPFGIAYGGGVAVGLQRAGIDVRTAPALGTSAGSWVAALMALGLGYDDIADVEMPPIPVRRRGAIAEVARSVFGDARHERVWACAFRIRGSGRGRVVLSGAEHDLADLCAASSAAPRLLPRHVVAGDTYVDGGVRSVTSIGLAPPAEHVIVVAPLARGVGGFGGTLVQRQLDREARAWRRANPNGTLTVITPSPEAAQLAGRSAKDLFDLDNARATYPLAEAQGERVGEALQRAQSA